MQRLLRPKLSDAERAYPALRRALRPSLMDRSATPCFVLSAPEGDWDEAVLAMHAQTATLIDAILHDSVHPLQDLPILEPYNGTRRANFINFQDLDGAQYYIDVEGSGPYRIRFGMLDWPDIPPDRVACFLSFLNAWRRTYLASGDAHEIADEGFNWECVLETGFGWCLGSDDAVHVKFLGDEDGLPSISVTRAFIYSFEKRPCC
jgi:hypothetical protein